MTSKLSTANLEPLAAPPASLSAALDRKQDYRIVTTSWDDGDPADLRVAELLAARRLPGTFYVPVRGHVAEGHRASRMSSVELKELSAQNFELGAHGISHPNLPACTRTQLVVEVEGSKKHLEDEIGREVSMFAYPRGRHNQRVIAALIKAGFAGARTTAMLARELEFERYRMPTSIHVFPHTRIEYFRNLARVWDARRTLAYATHFHCADNWVELAKTLFDSVLRNGGVWHLYGHSWEIEELGLWSQLEEVLDYVVSRPRVQYLPNGAIVELQEGYCRDSVRIGTQPLEPLAGPAKVEPAPARRGGI